MPEKASNADLDTLIAELSSTQLIHWHITIQNTRRPNEKKPVKYTNVIVMRS